MNEITVEDAEVPEEGSNHVTINIAQGEHPRPLQETTVLAHLRKQATSGKKTVIKDSTLEESTFDHETFRLALSQSSTGSAEVQPRDDHVTVLHKNSSFLVIGPFANSQSPINRTRRHYRPINLVVSNNNNGTVQVVRLIPAFVKGFPFMQFGRSSQLMARDDHAGRTKDPQLAGDMKQQEKKKKNQATKDKKRPQSSLPDDHPTKNKTPQREKRSHKQFLFIGGGGQPTNANGTIRVVQWVNRRKHVPQFVFLGRSDGAITEEDLLASQSHRFAFNMAFLLGVQHGKTSCEDFFTSCARNSEDVFASALKRFPF